MDFHPHSLGALNIPTHSSASTTLRCCCGRDKCALLEHNNVALEGLEKDLETAARLGQALLHRHESCMAEAKEDRCRLAASIDELEKENKQVQAENARIVEENRSLLEQLDTLNKAVAESDDHTKLLTITLESTKSELERLTVTANRAADLEVQLALMEAEQLKLQETLTSLDEDKASAVQRWKQAEHNLRNLHEEIDRIEKEAREENERHTEFVERMERKRAVERELDNAAGRLKGAAAASELNRNAGGTNVVSRFVKDILQDNANLQVGIMELRHMLDSSNEEVQNLREQVMSHHPLAGIDEEVVQPRASTTLSEELEAKEERRVSQEFHIHHHYHSPTQPAKKDKGPLNRRVKKRRPALGSPVTMHSAMQSHSPRRVLHRSQSSGSSMSTILSHTSVSIPPGSSRRWSLQSHAPESLASSPQSVLKPSSIFDHVERGHEFSQPTSPESTAFSSPFAGMQNFQRANLSFLPKNGFNGNDLSHSLSAFEDEEYHREFHNTGDIIKQPAIPEESETSPSVGHFDASQLNTLQIPDDELLPMHVQSPKLRKSSSHDSLLSVSVAGMDIHTPNSRHMRMGDWHHGMKIPQRILPPSVELVSTPPIISAPAIQADRATGLGHTSQSLLASMAAGNTKSDAASITSTDSTSTASSAKTEPRKATTFGRRVGGWVLGRWGTAPVSNDSHDPGDSTDSPNTSVATSPPIPAPKPDPLALRFRYPGVNQKGPIRGLRAPPAAPISVHPHGIDEDLLRESLAE